MRLRGERPGRWGLLALAGGLFAGGLLAGGLLAGGLLAAEGPAPPVRETVRSWLAFEQSVPALALSSEAVAREPRSAVAWAALAGALFRNGDFDGAEEAARRALALDPDDPDAHVALARALETRADHAGAREHLEQAVAAAPRHATALRLLAGKLDLNTERERALELAGRFIQLDPPGQALFVEHARQMLKALRLVGQLPLNQYQPWEARPERITAPLQAGEDGLKLELEFGGVKRTFKFDTGEEGLTVCPETAKQLGLKLVTALPSVTATGIERMAMVLVPALEFHGHRVTNLLAALGTSDLAGPGLFETHRITLDFSARRIVLDRQPRDAAPGPKDLLDVPEGARAQRFRCLGKLIWVPVSCPTGAAPSKERPAWGLLDSGCELPAALTLRYLEALRSVPNQGPVAIPLRSALGGAGREEGKPEILWTLPEFSLDLLGVRVSADGAVAAGSLGAVSRAAETELDLLVGWPVLFRGCKSIAIDYRRGVLTVEPREERVRP